VIARLPFAGRPYLIERALGDPLDSFLPALDLPQVHIMLSDYLLSFSRAEIVLMPLSILVSFAIVALVARNFRRFAARSLS
jgi:hypothetical protein